MVGGEGQRVKAKGVSNEGPGAATIGCRLNEELHLSGKKSH